MQIQGPAGALEARIDLAPAEKTITAILCHPHPLYGGSMHDAVLETVAGVLRQHGVNCLRFNFRGVGASEGSYAQGAGETEDLVAVADWVQQEYPRDKIWLVGYSFGASIVWRALGAIPTQRVLLIAPPLGNMAFEPISTTPAHIDAIAGDRDDFVDSGLFTAWEGVTAHTIEGADHFFAAHHGQLAEAVEQILSA